MGRINVVPNNKLRKGDSTQGIVRERAFETKDVVVARSRVAGGVASDWHHHGTRNLYGYLLSGTLRLEYGAKGRKAVEVKQGDFFHIPPRLVHRDVNPDLEREFVVVNILVGKGRPVINVRDP